jgi:hypothetical protein
MLSALDFLPGNHTADCSDACEHDVGELLYEKVGQRKMKPGVKDGQPTRDDRADNKYGAEQARHALKVRHDTLPLLGTIVSDQSKNRLKRNGNLTIASAMGCPFADSPECHKQWRTKGSKPNHRAVKGFA